MVGFFSAIGKVIGKAFDVISNLKITDIGDKLKEVFGGLKDAFGNTATIIAGNVATAEAFSDLSSWGADARPSPTPRPSPEARVWPCGR